MPAIYLGSIAPFKVSVFKVSATSGTGRSMIYSYKKGRLPQGLEIQPDGEIYGRMKDRVFTIDQGTTTFTGNDSSATSFDTEYYFTVTATDSQKLLSSDQQFMIRVYKDHFAAVANLFSRSYLDQTSRTNYEAFVNDYKVFEPTMLYRPDDEFFGKNYARNWLFLSGIKLENIKTIVQYMENNHFDTRLYFGDIKTAKAKTNSGDTVYEVVYAEMIDPNESIQEDSTLKSVANQAQFEIGTKYYTNSVENLRNEIKDRQFGPYYVYGKITKNYSAFGGNEDDYDYKGKTTSQLTSQQLFNLIGSTGYHFPVYLSQPTAKQADIDAGGIGTYHAHYIEGYGKQIFYMPDTSSYHGQSAYDSSLATAREYTGELYAGAYHPNEYLPLWMQTDQGNGQPLGYTKAMVLAYVKAGFSDIIKYRIENNIKYDLKSLDTKVDRWEMDMNLGTTFDRNIKTRSTTADGSTLSYTFPIPNLLINQSASIKVTDEDEYVDPSLYTVSSNVGAGDSSADSTLAGITVTFTTAPVEGHVIIVTTKPTTFQERLEATFDHGAVLVTDGGDSANFVTGEYITGSSSGVSYRVERHESTQVHNYLDLNAGDSASYTVGETVTGSVSGTTAVVTRFTYNNIPTQFDGGGTRFQDDGFTLDVGLHIDGRYHGLNETTIDKYLLFPKRNITG